MDLSLKKSILFCSNKNIEKPIYMMNKALQKIAEFYDDRARRIIQGYFLLLQDMPGSKRLFKRITASTSREQVEDYLAEVRYTLIFSHVGFGVEIEPFGNKGPDLRVSREGYKIIVEIKRLRKVYPGPPDLDFSADDFMLPAYGDVKRDTRKAFEKIISKFSQLGDEDSIIAIWNDEEELDEIEISFAVADLRNDADKKIIKLPDGLQFLLYGSKWVGRTQFRCFPFRPLEQYYQSLQREFEGVRVSHIIQSALVQLENNEQVDSKEVL